MAGTVRVGMDGARREDHELPVANEPHPRRRRTKRLFFFGNETILDTSHVHPWFYLCVVYVRFRHHHRLFSNDARLFPVSSRVSSKHHSFEGVGISRISSSTSSGPPLVPHARRHDPSAKHAHPLVVAKVAHHAILHHPKRRNSLLPRLGL